MSKWFKEFLQTVFKIEPGEFIITAIMFIYLQAATGTFIVARITRDVIFMDIPGWRQKLPLVYMAVAIVVAVIMYLYTRVERKLRRDRTNEITLIVLFFLMILSRYLLLICDHWFKWAFYVLVEIMGSFLIVQFWSIANEIFHTRQAKRLFAVIGSGGVLANIIAGFGVRSLVKIIGTPNMLYVIAALLAVAFVMVFLISGRAKNELEEAWQKKAVRRVNQPEPPKKEKEPIFATRHLKTIAVIVVITYIVSTLVDYEFKAILGDIITETDARSQYYGLFFGLTGILAAIIQLFCTSRILERFGLLPALLLLPCAMFGGSMALFLLPSLLTVTLAKGSENVLRYTVNDAAMQLLYLPVPAAQRGRAKAFIDGILKHAATGSAGLLLFLATAILPGFINYHIKPEYFSLPAMALLLIWALLVIRLKKEYVASLLNTLHKRRLDFSDSSIKINDENTLKVVLDALSSNKRGYVLHAFELLPFVEQTGKEINDKIIELLSSGDHNVQIAALDYLAKAALPIQADKLRELLKSPNEAVRAAAIKAYSAREKQKAAPEIEIFLDDESPLVKASAVSSLIRFCGLNGVLRSADTLKNMLAAQDIKLREMGARVLGEINVPTFYEPLLPMLKDESHEVRSAAIEAAGKLHAEEFLQPLLEELKDSRFAAMAVNALVRYGSAIEEELIAIMDDSQKDPKVRENIPKILVRIGGQKSADAVSKQLLSPLLPLRFNASRALSLLLLGHQEITFDMPTVRAAFNGEVGEFLESAAMELDLAITDGNKSDLLFLDTFRHRRQLNLKRIFKLLEIIYPGTSWEVIYQNLGSPQKNIRANAIELLDNILEAADKALILPIIELTDLKVLLSKNPQIRRRSADERLKDFLSSRDRWLQNVAIYYIGTKKLSTFVLQLEAAQKAADEVVRQSALWALSRMPRHMNSAHYLEVALADRSPLVKNYALSLKAELNR